MKKEEREIFYIILLCNLYYFNMQYEKNKIWVVGYIIKWYGIINKVVFWDDKIEWNAIFGCECSNNNNKFLLIRNLLFLSSTIINPQSL